MVAKVAATSKCREKSKKPVLAKDPEEMPPPYMLVYHHCHQHPVPHPYLQHQMGKPEGQTHL
jgi:hypothetical protein